MKKLVRATLDLLSKIKRVRIVYVVIDNKLSRIESRPIYTIPKENNTFYHARDILITKHWSIFEKNSAKKIAKISNGEAKLRLIILEK